MSSTASMAEFQNNLFLFTQEMREKRTQAAPFLYDTSLSSDPDQFSTLLGLSNDATIIFIKIKSLSIPGDISDWERSEYAILLDDANTFVSKLMEKLSKNESFKALVPSSYVPTPPIINPNNVNLETASQSRSYVYPPMPSMLQRNRSSMSFGGGNNVLPSTPVNVIRREALATPPPLPSSFRRNINNETENRPALNQDDLDRRLDSMTQNIESKFHMFEALLLASKNDTRDAVSIMLEQFTAKQKIQVEYKVVEDSREGRIGQLLKEFMSTEAIAQRNAYRSEVMTSKFYNEKFTTTLKNISSLQNKSIDLIDLKGGLDVYDTGRFFVDHFKSLVGHYIKDPEDKEYLGGQILMCNIFILQLSTSTKTWFISKTKFYENYDLIIYYDIEKLLMFFSISLMAENAPQIAYTTAAELRYTDFENFDAMVIQFEILIKKNFGASTAYILSEEIITDWLAKKPNMLYYPKLREAVLDIESVHRNFEMLRQAILKIEITYKMTTFKNKGNMNFMGSSLNFMGNQGTSELDDIDVDNELTFITGNSQLYYAQGKKWDNQHVVNHNDAYLKRLKPDAFKTVANVNKCFTCGSVGHFMRDCFKNKGKPYAEWGQEFKPPALDNYKSVYRIQKNSNDVNQLKLLNDDSESEEEKGNFLAYMGPEGLDGTLCQMCSVQLFLKC